MTTPLDAHTTDLYRAYDADGTLVYVGITVDLKMRLRKHALASAWFSHVARVETETFPNRPAALDAEDAAIRNEAPVYNTPRRSAALPPIMQREAAS